MSWNQLQPPTNPNNSARRSHLLLPQNAWPLYSSEKSRPSRAITESSLPFTDGDLCSGLSQWHNPVIAALGYLVEHQEEVER